MTSPERLKAEGRYAELQKRDLKFREGIDNAEKLRAEKLARLRKLRHDKEADRNAVDFRNGNSCGDQVKRFPRADGWLQRAIYDRTSMTTRSPWAAITRFSFGNWPVSARSPAGWRWPNWVRFAEQPYLFIHVRPRLLPLVRYPGYGRYGYRRIRALLQAEGFNVNLKRVYRIWRREGLKVPQKQPRRGRLWLNDGSCIRLRPEREGHVWSYDFVQDRTQAGRAFRMLTPK